MGELDIPKIKPQDKEQIRSASNIYLWLDSYDDIFSDFDPRPFSQRMLSDDFISEAKKEAKEKVMGAAELRLLVPESRRKTHTETIIKKRIKEYFRHQHFLIHKEVKSTIRQGILFTLVGIVLMFTGAALLHHEAKGFLFYLILTIIEPASWFLFWEGMNHSIFEWKRFQNDLEFNSRMSKILVQFHSY